MNNRLEGSTTLRRPSWTGLYVRAALMLGVLLVAQAVIPPGAERTALQCGLVLAGFGAMVQWTRRNRAALDHLDWCACASERTTIRVIPSGRKEPTYTRLADAPLYGEPAPAELEEISR